MAIYCKRCVYLSGECLAYDIELEELCVCTECLKSVCEELKKTNRTEAKIDSSYGMTIDVQLYHIQNDPDFVYMSLDCPNFSLFGKEDHNTCIVLENLPDQLRNKILVKFFIGVDFLTSPETFQGIEIMYTDLNLELVDVDAKHFLKDFGFN